MIEPDTIKLLRECDAGIKMGTASIADVLDKVNDTKLKEMLENCRTSIKIFRKNWKVCWKNSMMMEKNQIQWHRGCPGSKLM